MKPTYEELQAENTILRAQVSELMATIKLLKERIANLEAQLNQNSKNSSKPPSSDQKTNVPPKKRKEGRPYHPGASRQLLSEDMITSQEERIIKNCPNCGSLMELTGKVSKWQQIEMPEIKPLVHQIDLHTCQCPNCCFKGRPALQDHEQFLLGPRMEAFVNLCIGRFRQGHRSVREFVSTIFPGLFLSQGLISKVKKRAACAFKSVNDKLKASILDTKDPIYVDATSWRHLGRNENAIVMRTGNLITFLLVPRQNGETLSEIFAGQTVNHLVTDRGLAVSKISMRLHQYCLAHLLRNIRGLAEHPSTTIQETEKLGDVYDTIQELFRDKHRLDREEISVSTWRQYSYTKWRYIKEIFEDLLDKNPTSKVKRSCKRILRNWTHFIIYLRSRDGPMTNNLAEESLRNLVIVRKLCFGSRSEYGRSWRASIQSCIETLKRQGRSVLDFITKVLYAERIGDICPNI